MTPDDRDEEIRKLRAALEESRRARSSLLSLIGHDLRTPLNIINGCAEHLLSGDAGVLSQEQRDSLVAIKRSERQLLSRVEQMQIYARVMSATEHYELASVRLHGSLLDIEPRVRSVLTTREISYRYAGCDRNVTVRADPDKLQHIMLRLVHNAARNMASGGTVSVSARVMEDSAVIEVTDVGRGFTETQLSTLFEMPDGRDDRRFQSGDGLSIGLATARAIARDMGGDLSVVSVRGSGSTFTLLVPLCP